MIRRTEIEAMKSSEQYLIDAAGAVELARQQSHSPAAMAARAELKRLMEAGR